MLTRADVAAVYLATLEGFCRRRGCPRSALHRLDDFARHVAGGGGPRPESPPAQRPPVGVFPGLRAQAFHEPASHPRLLALAQALEAATPALREEARAALEQPLADYEATLRHRMRPGSWRSAVIHRDYTSNRARFPVAAELLERFADELVPGSEWIYSVLGPGVEIPLHCDGTNVALTCHLPLLLAGDCALEVGGEVREHVVGEALFFDHSFAHRAWNRSSAPRVVLLFDLRHPDLDELEWAALTELSAAVFEATGHGLGF